MDTLDNGMINVIQNPKSGTFVETVANVLTILALPSAKAHAYECNFWQRYGELGEDLRSFSAYSSFAIIHLSALCATFNLDPDEDGRLINRGKAFLWRALTGVDPEIAADLQPVATAHLLSLGVR